MNRSLSHPVVQILCLIALLAFVHLVNVILSMWFNQFGVVPRTVVGLRGILFSPLLHGNWTHLAANAAPLGVMLGLLVLMRGRQFWLVTATLWLCSGIAVWLIGRPASVQIGASGLIYALAAFILTTAWLRRDVKSAIAALVVIVVYGSIVWGLLPNRSGVSWEGHLGGAVAGVIVAMVFSKLAARRLPGAEGISAMKD